MRVLLVNKFFHPRAGAETSFLHTRDLLVARGDDVIDFAMAHPDNLASPYSRYFARERSYGHGGRPSRRALDAAASIYSIGARRSLARLLDAHRPDVAHLHNVYHQLTLSVVDELARRSIPIVLTVHDYKIACPAYTLFTDGAPCRRCATGSVLSAVGHRCVKGSRAASTLAAAETGLARRRRSYAKVTRFIAPSAFARDIVAMAGIPPERITVAPNFLPDDQLTCEARPDDDGPGLLYAGRLEETKGVAALLDAFERVPEPVTLAIAGRGELEAQVRAAAARNPRVRFLGMLDHGALLREMRRARAVVLPSRYEDNGPLVILEAQAQARAMIVTDLGGPPEFVRDGETGLVVDPASVDALAEAMTRLALDPALARRLGERALHQVRDEHGAARHYERLQATYTAAIEETVR